jgi:hypothetical protein
VGGPPTCLPSQLTAQFWTSTPRGHLTLSGFNFINNSAAPCDLPEFPQNLTITSSSGQPVSPTAVSDLSNGASTTMDFQDANTLEASGSQGTQVASSFGLPSDVYPLELLPSGKVVVVLFELDGPGGLTATGAPAQSCIAAPNGGALTVSLTSAGVISIPVPVEPAPPGSDVDPTGSALWSCSTILVSPFLTRAQAVSIVGYPGLGDASHPLATRDDVLYANAP